MKLLTKIIGIIAGLIMLAVYMSVTLGFYALIGTVAGFILQWLAGEWIINLFATFNVSITSVWPIGLLIGVFTSLIRLSTTVIKFKTSL